MHASDLFRLAYKSLSDAPWRSANFPRSLTASMDAEFDAQGPALASKCESGYDLSVKFLVKLVDQESVESVLMPEKRRLTLCLSTQVGCAQGCVFCHTGRMGLKRHLTTGEIVGQVVAANRWLTEHPEWLESARLPKKQKITNIVFMGMGEPLDNVQAVIDAVTILSDPLGLAIGLSHISVSTAGHLDGLKAIVQAIPKVRLALSVHSTDGVQRSRIMPINRRWPLEEVVQFLEQCKDGRPPVLLQYTMICGVNDSLSDARTLGDIAVRLGAKINLIPLNSVDASRLSAPPAETIQEFRDVLHGLGLRVMVRYSKGQDIAAACGQLVIAGAAKGNRSRPARRPDADRGLPSESTL